MQTITKTPTYTHTALYFLLLIESIEVKRDKMEILNVQPSNELMLQHEHCSKDVQNLTIKKNKIIITTIPITTAECFSVTHMHLRISLNVSSKVSAVEHLMGQSPAFHLYLQI